MNFSDEHSTIESDFEIFLQEDDGDNVDEGEGVDAVDQAETYFSVGLNSVRAGVRPSESRFVMGQISEDVDPFSMVPFSVPMEAPHNSTYTE